jgi:hypothetical protein
MGGRSESGAISPNGLIQGNDNDTAATKFEPHYTEIRQPDQVQIYESIMSDPAGTPTTGLLTAVRYLKDNRLLPRGFDKASANADVAVQGGAASDADFTGGGDRVRYSVDTPRPGTVSNRCGNAFPATRIPVGSESEALRRPRNAEICRLLRFDGIRFVRAACTGGRD